MLNLSEVLLTTLIGYNFLSAMHHSMQDEVEEINERRQTPCQPNRNVGIGILKSFIVRLFLRPRENLDTEIAHLKRFLLKCLEPIKVKNRPKEPKMMRLGERHNWDSDFVADCSNVQPHMQQYLCCASVLPLQS